MNFNLPKEAYVIIGVIIGGFISIAINLINLYFQNKRDNNKLALEMAKIDFQTQVDVLIKNPSQKKVLPLEAFTQYYFEYLKILGNKRIKNIDYKKLAELKREISISYFEE